MLNQNYIGLIKEKIYSIENNERQEKSLTEFSRLIADENNTFCISHDNFGVIGDTIVSYDGNKSVVKIPSSILGHEIKRIGSGAFCGDRKIRVIEIEEGIEQIGEEAFHRCSNIVHIILPSTIKSVEEGAFDKSMRPEDVTVTLSIDKSEYTLLMQSGIETTDGLILLDQSLIGHYEIEKRYNLPEMKYPRPSLISKEMGAVFIRRNDSWDILCFKGSAPIKDETDGVIRIIKEGRQCLTIEKAESYSDRCLNSGCTVRPDRLRLALLDDSKTRFSYGMCIVSIRFIIRDVFFQSVERFIAGGQIYYAYSRKYLTDKVRIPYEKEFKYMIKQENIIPPGDEEELALRKYRLIAELG